MSLARRAPLFAILSLLVQPAFAAFDIEGFLHDSDGNALPGTYKMALEIQKAGEPDCILYREEFDKVSVDVAGSFIVTVGQGERISGFDSVTVDQVLLNQSTLYCRDSNGSVKSTYTPSAGDGRALKVDFDIGSGTVISLGPSPLSAVPYSTYAKYLDQHSAKSLLRVEDSGTPKEVSPLSSSDVDELRKLLDGSSTQYMPRSASAGASLPSYSGGPASPQAGSIWYDSVDQSIKFYNGSTTVMLGTGSGSGTVTSISVGEGLKANGVPGGQITTSGTIEIDTISSPGTVSGDAIISGTIGGNTSINTSGSISTTSSVSSGSISTRIFDLYDTDNSKRIRFQVPSSLADDYTLTWPETAGSSGQVLTTDGSGNLSWTTLSGMGGGGGGGTVTEVTVSGVPLSVTNSTTTPKISISQAGPNSSGYLSQADWNTFNSKLDPGLNSGQIFVGNSSNVATARTPSGDVSMDESGAFTVTRIQGSAIGNTAPVDGQVLKYVGGGTNAWVPSSFSVGDLKTAGGMQQFANAACSASQTLTWNSLTDTFTCSNISGLDASVISSGTLDIARIPTGSTAGTVAAGNDSRIVNAVQKTGDTMSGTLELPANGLKVGSDQLVASGGRIGIGTTTPSALLDVAGTLKIGYGGELCSAEGAGMIRFSSGTFQVCNGSSWQTLGVSGAGLMSLNGQTGSTQTLTVELSGTAPEFSSAANVHALHIPMASNTGVTAGLISKEDYDTFSAKQPAGNYITALTGDVAASGPGSATATIQNNAVTTAKIANGAVTYSKIQSVTSGRILGRSTTGTGSIEEIQIGGGLTLSNGVLSSTANGTVMNVSSTNSYLTVTNNSTAPQLTLNVGQVANTVAAGNDSRFPASACDNGKKMRWDGASWVCEPIAAHDVDGTMSIEQGGTGLSQLPGPDQILIGNGTGGYELLTIKTGPGIHITKTTNKELVITAGITSCPSGWAMVGDPGDLTTFCIQMSRQGPKSWLNAHDQCRTIREPGFGRAHLCSFREWYAACKSAAVSINNQEWIDDITNKGVDASAFLAGGSNCNSFDESEIRETNYFRCCLN